MQQILMESCALHRHTVPWLVNDHTQQVLITNHYSGAGKVVLHVFIQQIFMVCLHCAKHCSELWRPKSGKE